MADQVKTMGEWEKERGLIIDGADPKQKLSGTDFDKIPLRDKIGVDHESRIAFLRSNGYEVDRKNMIDSNLSAQDK